jgi:hypothetical protein
MEDPAEQMIRRALGRRPPPRLGPTFAEDVVRRVATRKHVLPGRAGARRWLAAATWLLAGGASVAVLVHLEWSSPSRVVAWGLALAMVPVAYAATLWPGRILGVLALCSAPLLGEPREPPPARGGGRGSDGAAPARRAGGGPGPLL